MFIFVYMFRFQIKQISYPYGHYDNQFNETIVPVMHTSLFFIFLLNSYSSVFTSLHIFHL